MAIPNINTLEELGGPFEILELGDRGVKELVVERYKVGRMTIHPRPNGAAKQIVALRVWVPAEIKTLFPDYYDITSQTLIAQLLPLLESGEFKTKRFVVTKYGTGPQARFTVEVTW